MSEQQKACDGRQKDGVRSGAGEQGAEKMARLRFRSLVRAVGPDDSARVAKSPGASVGGGSDLKADAGGVQERQISYPSWDDSSDIHGTIWYPCGYPDRKPRAVVQLIHGMAEHIGRYDDFARFLAAHGFAVCGHDHIGHGMSVRSKEELGHMPPEIGADVLVEDADTLRTIAQEAFGAEAPYFMFGHSMGSYVLRVYLTRHGSGLDGAVICGTGHEPKAISLAGNLLAGLGASVRGETTRSPLIHSMADGAFQRQVDDPQTEFDWISFDRDNIDRFMEDDLNGFMFTLGGYSSLTRLTLLAADLELAKSIPNELPLLFVAGTEDPVGNKGEGVREAVSMMLKSGARDVELVLYEGMRHEILNETGSDIVYADILGWIESLLASCDE